MQISQEGADENIAATLHIEPAFQDYIIASDIDLIGVGIA